MLPVVVRGEVALASAGGTIELLAGRARMRVEVGTDVRYVAALVAAIEGAC